MLRAIDCAGRSDRAAGYDCDRRDPCRDFRRCTAPGQQRHCSFAHATRGLRGPEFRQAQLPGPDAQGPQELPDLTRCELARFEDRAFLTGFCKTARKPYDIAVTSILLRCRHLAPDAFVIDSDGAWELEWQSGAMHWQPSCVTGAAPVEVVALLFGQAETRENTRLLAGLHLQPRCLQSDAAQPTPAPVGSPAAV